MADFDEKAPEYDAWYHTQKGALVDALETACAFSLFKPEKGQRILDAGCGTGNFSLKLAAMGAVIEGVDVSAEMLAIGRAKAEASDVAAQIHYQEMDLYQLNFPDNHFDAVVSMAAFEFIHDKPKALAEFMRVVKPGGKVMIGTITGNSSWGLEYQSHMHREDSVFHHAAFSTLAEMEALMPETLVASRESVFLPFDTPDEEATAALDDACREQGAVGAFVCLLWEKPRSNA